jgi:hypothetical protein
MGVGVEEDVGIEGRAAVMHGLYLTIEAHARKNVWCKWNLGIFPYVT